MSECAGPPLRAAARRRDRTDGAPRTAGRRSTCSPTRPTARAPFRDVTRQTLFRRDDLAGELRYFEVAPGGHSTLERHAHVHAVLILRGRGTLPRRRHGPSRSHEHDLVTVPPGTWHQFRADADAPLGFLCMVDAVRDKPELPDAAALEAMRAHADVGRFPRRDADHG